MNPKFRADGSGFLGFSHLDLTRSRPVLAGRRRAASNMRIKYMFIVQRYFYRATVRDLHRECGLLTGVVGFGAHNRLVGQRTSIPGVPAGLRLALNPVRRVLSSCRRRTVPPRHAPALRVVTPEQEAEFDLVGPQLKLGVTGRTRSVHGNIVGAFTWRAEVEDLAAFLIRALFDPAITIHLLRQEQPGSFSQEPPPTAMGEVSFNPSVGADRTTPNHNAKNQGPQNQNAPHHSGGRVAGVSN
jgi:hypothetical protein